MKLLKTASWLLAFAFFFLIPPTQAVAGEELPDTRHTYLAKGLQQFPSLKKLEKNWILATLRGDGYIKCPKFTVPLYGDSPRCMKFQLVTREGKDIDITVIVPAGGHDSPFMHEISPSIGKYLFWSPVILLAFPKELASGREFPEMYVFFEISLIGRFFYHEQPGDQKGHYHNEVYPVDPH